MMVCDTPTLGVKRIIDQLPRDLADRVDVVIHADAYGIKRSAVFIVKTGNRRFACPLNDKFRVPDEFIAHLCVVV